MSSVVLSGDTSGTVTVTVPAVAGTNTVTIPAQTGNVPVMPTGYTLGAGNTSGFKNRIINGAMVIDQRNAGASVTPTNTNYTLDRWRCLLTQSSKLTIQQNAGSVTPPAGFTNYLGVTSSSAYSVASGDVFSVNQRIEGLNCADLGWGTANAKTVTLSFWVRSSLTGTFGGALLNSAFNRSYPYSYTISSANTWEQKSITIPGDTTGTWLTTNGIGINVTFSLGTGTTYSGTAGSWAATEYDSVTGATSVVGTNGATWYITGVQLEVGSQATSFDYRDYGRELSMCQRYYVNGLYLNGFAEFSTSFCLTPTFPVAMRTTPTASVSGALVIYDGAINAGQSVASAGTISGNNKSALIYNTGNFSSLTQYRPGSMNPVGGTGTFAFSAEL